MDEWALRNLEGSSLKWKRGGPQVIGEVLWLPAVRHACACARVLMCMLGCLMWWWDLQGEKHSLLHWQEQGTVLCSSSQPPMSFSLSLSDVSRLRQKHCILRVLALLCSLWPGSAEKSSSAPGLAPSSAPSSCIPHLLLPPGLCQKGRAAEASGWRVRSWACLPPSPPTGARWCLKHSLSLGPLYTNLNSKLGLKFCF